MAELLGNSTPTKLKEDAPTGAPPTGAPPTGAPPTGPANGEPTGGAPSGPAKGGPSGGGAPGGGGGPTGGGGPDGGGGPGGSGKPAGGGTLTGTGAPAGPSGGGAAPTGGGAPAPDGKPSGGGAPGADGKPSGGGAADPAGKPAPTIASGSGAKAQAESAQKALADINGLASQIKSAEAEANKLTTDAQAGKKQADDAKRQADAAEKSLPAAPKVPVPTGNDPKAQYESAIQITGDTRKTQQDADAKAATIQEQVGMATEGDAKANVADQAAKQHVEKVKQLVSQGETFASSANTAAGEAANLAAESKKKADQAVKDKAADKDALVKAAQEDTTHAAAAKTAAANAQAALKQLQTSAKNAETQTQNIAKTKEETKAAVDAVTQQDSAFKAKLEPFAAAVDQAEHQEAEYKAKLSEEDAEAILKKKYEELGGDPELEKALADEDKEFQTHVEKYRLQMKDWQKKKIRQLDEHKAKLEGTLKILDAIVPARKKWLDRESPIADQVSAEANSLGEKLKTEPGKELVHEINQWTTEIARLKGTQEFNQKLAEKTKASLETLKERYKDIDKEYEASEKRIKDMRTELDNLLQIKAQPLEQKVDYLQTRPKPVRDRIAKQLESDMDRILRISILDAKAEVVEFQEEVSTDEPPPIEWNPIKERITALKAAKLEDLKKGGPLDAEIQAEYDKAGGDPALLEKRIAAWKSEVAAGEELDKGRADDGRKRLAKLQEQFEATKYNLQVRETAIDSLNQIITTKETRFKELGTKIDPHSLFKNFSDQEKAEYQLLERALKRHKTELENLRAEYATKVSAKDNAEKLLEQERQRHEQIVDDDRRSVPKPTSEDIHKLPLRAKYTELLGKMPPSGGF
jgi:chromosome segregation ATPase